MPTRRSVCASHACPVTHYWRHAAWQQGGILLREAAKPAGSRPCPAGPSVRTVVGWITRHPDTLSEDEIAQFKAVRAAVRLPPAGKGASTRA